MNEEIQEHKCEIIERHSKGIEFAEKKNIYWFSPEQFEKELYELSKRYPEVVIEVIDGIRNIIFADSIYRELLEEKQEIIEIVDFRDNKERTVIHLKDFDKYLNNNKNSQIYKFNNQRMIIYTDQILVEAKKDIKNDIQYS